MIPYAKHLLHFGGFNILAFNTTDDRVDNPVVYELFAENDVNSTVYKW